VRKVPGKNLDGRVNRDMILNWKEIEKKRKKCGITKTELAKRCNISKQLLDYYRRHPSCLRGVSAFAGALKCSGKNLLLDDYE